MASSAAGDPSHSQPPPPPPRGWLSGLVSGAGRLLAAVLDTESSASDTTSSSPESSQSPPRRALAAAEDDGTGTCLASDSYQLNLSGQEIVLKDSGEGSFAIVSEIHPKEAVKQLLMQDTYSRSECDALIKIIQERMVDSDPGVDEAEIILPIAWHDSTQEHPVAYSSSPNIVEKEWLNKTSTTIEDCTVGNDSCSASKLMLRGDIEAAPSSSMGLQPVNSSKNCKRGFNLVGGIPTKTRSPATASRTRRPNDGTTARSWNGPPQLNNPAAAAGQEADASRTQAKRPVGRPRRGRR
ncbi:hypothetical protein HU200_040367 [Digitaria exilis]|uniref:Uncharacterized protein n=1 Tax=Digitaria exilis TaxID=1010633 RepID=A0A835BAB7_9POAL|nr:hypothetical protein HU200_040367 [Digitaria exilis]